MRFDVDPGFEATIEARLGTIAQRGLIRLELDAMRALLIRLGSPQQLFRTVHVAGTNGKGSTAALIESCLRAAGFRTGLYTSPHLQSYRERIRLDGEPVAAQQLLDVLNQTVLPAARELALVPTEFDLLTAAAFRLFAEAEIDIAIVEVGLGGRLDSTNVLEAPLVSVISSIALDHTDRLGTTVAAIAAEKAGIVKPGRPVVTAAIGDAREVIRQVALEHDAPLTVAEPCQLVAAGPEGQRVEYAPEGGSVLAGEYQMPLFGAHQRLNLALALRALDAIAAIAPVSRAEALYGVSTAQWPGRLELLHAGGRTWLLDGAHNPDGCAALKAALAEHFPGRPLGLVLGMVADKDWSTMAGGFADLAERTWLTNVPNPRGVDPELVSNVLVGPSVQVVQPFASALDAAAVWAAQRGPEAMTVIAGSLFLVGACRTELQQLPMTGDGRMGRYLPSAHQH